MTSERKPGGGETIAAALMLGIALIVCAFVVKSALITVKGFGRTISVTGAASKPITSDFALWDGKIQASAATLENAYAKVNKGLLETRAFMAAQGFAEKEYDIGAVQMNRYQDRETGAVTYYLVSTVKAQSSDIERIKSLSVNAAALIEKGIEFVSQTPRYICTRTDEVKIEMIKAATENAKLRAEQLAQSTGRKIGAPTSARVGVFQIRPRNSQEVSDYGVNDVTSIEKEIVCTVQASFLIE